MDRGEPRQSEGHLGVDIPKNNEGSLEFDKQGSSLESVPFMSHRINASGSSKFLKKLLNGRTSARTP